MKIVYALYAGAAVLVAVGLFVCFLPLLAALFGGLFMILTGVCAALGAVGLSTDPQAREQVNQRLAEFRQGPPTA